MAEETEVIPVIPSLPTVVTISQGQPAIAEPVAVSTATVSASNGNSSESLLGQIEGVAEWLKKQAETEQSLLATLRQLLEKIDSQVSEVLKQQESFSEMLEEAETEEEEAETEEMTDEDSNTSIPQTEETAVVVAAVVPASENLEDQKAHSESSEPPPAPPASEPTLSGPAPAPRPSMRYRRI